MKRVVIFVIAVFFVASGIALISAAEVKKGAETYTIDKCQKLKGPAPFDHYKHQALEGVTCKKCHHEAKEGETPKSCFECHQCAKKGEKPNAKIAFHKNCKGCHVEMKKAGKKTGPTKCNECHLKVKK